MNIFDRRIPELDFTWEVIAKDPKDVTGNTYICAREVGDRIVVKSELEPLSIGMTFEWVNPIVTDFMIIPNTKIFLTCLSRN